MRLGKGFLDVEKEGKQTVKCKKMTMQRMIALKSFVKYIDYQNY